MMSRSRKVVHKELPFLLRGNSLPTGFVGERKGKSLVVQAEVGGEHPWRAGRTKGRKQGRWEECPMLGGREEPGPGRRRKGETLWFSSASLGVARGRWVPCCAELDPRIQLMCEGNKGLSTKHVPHELTGYGLSSPLPAGESHCELWITSGSREQGCVLKVTMWYGWDADQFVEVYQEGEQDRKVCVARGSRRAEGTLHTELRQFPLPGFC